ncbi:glycosyltransferase [Blastopirellula marina]|uniref:Glycosyltransferase n=2 Tax=Blastopirellula marina TaxID=124 RepID=A0A2S8GNH2_9BACT|nr:glycosyltransferase [Blastopirellula marina]
MASHSLEVAETPNSTSNFQQFVDAVSIFGVSIHRVTMRQAVAKCMEWIDSPLGSTCRYVVTPNVNHVVLLRKHQGLRAAYQQASLVVADGWPLVTTSQLAGDPLPERVAGSDLIPQIFSAGEKRGGVRAFLLGAESGVAAEATKRVMANWPSTNVVGNYSPPLGFEHCDQENQRIVEMVNRAQPDLLVVGLGAPKQETWLHNHFRQLEAKVAVAAGGTIDFLAGKQKRAPRWVQQMRLEWLFRLATDPRRLAGRYARDAMIFPSLAATEILRTRLHASRSANRLPRN